MGLDDPVFSLWHFATDGTCLALEMTLEPLGEHPRRTTCIDSIFMSYAASLVVPRVGEVTRCGTLKKCDGVSFTKSLGTVVTERLVDSLLMLAFTGLAFLLQLPMFMAFLDKTGTDFDDILHRFTPTGYLVTLVCIIAAVVATILLLRRYAFLKKGVICCKVCGKVFCRCAV